jgi:hypothetical protein
VDRSASIVRVDSSRRDAALSLEAVHHRSQGAQVAREVGDRFLE